MAFRKKLFLATAWCLLLGTSAAMAAPAASPFGDTAYYKLGDPETFRLLSGMNVPDPGKHGWIDRYTTTDKADLAQLFPNLSDSDYYSLPYSGCRIATPLD